MTSKESFQKLLKLHNYLHTLLEEKFKNTNLTSRVRRSSKNTGEIITYMKDTVCKLIHAVRSCANTYNPFKSYLCLVHDQIQFEFIFFVA